MANDKTQSEKLTVEGRLVNLYKLQSILSEIDRIRTIRGELPAEVKDMEDNLEGLRTRVANLTADIEDFNKRLVAEKEHIEESKSKIARYKEQLDNVRNNREFDLLTKEVEFESLEIQLAEKHINEYGRIIEQKKSDIQQAEADINDREHILNEKRSELEEIVSETRQDEERLRAEALKIEETLVDDPRTLAAFKRIRKNARNGLGVVCIERNACGGCFNRIPPQKQLEIKMHKKIIVCEYCGRILVDPDLEGIKPAEA
ncbi:MAG: hypothetical protein K2G64_06490 [Muribaculaceae bacterium]|nr:hypothetical protein [Muribaculaceae bacterium]MDE5968735.1 hypothetical protein [Muribaculaceae bacterium]